LNPKSEIRNLKLKCFAFFQNENYNDVNQKYMPYLSDLLDNKVWDSADDKIGYLEDVIVEPKPGEYVPLKYLVIRKHRNGHLIFVPYKYVENFTKDEVSLKTRLAKIPYLTSVDNNCLFLRENVLDQQIVDISGARVVRVNDLRIGEFEGQISVLGIDVSFKGILRRLGLGWLDFLDLAHVRLIDWRQTQPIHGTLKLDTVSKNLNKLHPADLANIIETLNVKHGGKLVTSMDTESAATVLQEVNPNLRKSLIKYLSPDEASHIVEKMSVEEIVDLAKSMHKEDADLLLSSLRRGKLKDVERLIHYPNDTAGGLMMVNFMTLRQEWTVLHSINEIKKKSSEFDSLVYAYVTDENGIFIGVVSMRNLLIAPKEKTIKNIMKHLTKKSFLRVSESFETVVEIMTKYNLYTGVVLDDDDKLVGIISIDDVMRHFVPNA
jgi:magnesium transporter